nr:MAG TPA: hypothetical protein [Caudoviricetes sp.]
MQNLQQLNKNKKRPGATNTESVCRVACPRGYNPT